MSTVWYLVNEDAADTNHSLNFKFGGQSKFSGFASYFCVKGLYDFTNVKNPNTVL